MSREEIHKFQKMGFGNNSIESSLPTGTEAEICRDLMLRQMKGIEKYGTTVRENPLSLRDWLQHLFEETLDSAVYIKRAIEEIDKSK